MDLRGLYTEHYKKLFFIPIILVVLAFGVLLMNYVSTGDIIDKDVSLKGGTTLTVYTTDDFTGLDDHLRESLPGSDLNVRELSEFASDVRIGFIVEASDVDDQELLSAVEEFVGFGLTSENYSLEIVGSALGESFYQQMLVAIGLAFLFMAIVVFITFRSFVPSFAVVFAAFSDMVVTLAIFSLFDVRLSTSGIAALLLLIGYSIDTDILLTTKVLKRTQGKAVDRMIGAMKTGLTMTGTTLVALTVALLVSNSLVLKQMFLVIVVGLLVDIVVTYAMNAGVLVWYARRKNQ
tara:strand:- start:2471 stop:3346 length:876 start_codon:yes stop_codon:yes gene_type:complete